MARKSLKVVSLVVFAVDGSAPGIAMRATGFVNAEDERGNHSSLSVGQKLRGSLFKRWCNASSLKHTDLDRTTVGKIEPLTISRSPSRRSTKTTMPGDDDICTQLLAERSTLPARLVTQCEAVLYNQSLIRSVCVNGGGPSGLGCCRVLCDAGLAVTLVQESRGLGGKLCTKFVNGKDDPALHFDMGVQLLRPVGPLQEALTGADVPVAPWPQPGRFKRIICKGSVDQWQITSTSDLPTDGCVVGVPSMSTIGHYLAEQCKGLAMHVDRTAAVRDRHPDTGHWTVEWRRAAPNAGQLRYRPDLKDVPAETGRGEFDAVILAFEANKILHGCKSGYKMVQPSATPAIIKRASRAKTSQLWNLMVAFDSDLGMPWDAASVEGHPSIAWVAVDSSKPRRARLPQCFMVFSTRLWADRKQWSRQMVERELLEDFLKFLSAALGSRVPKPCFVLSGRWGNNAEKVLTGERPQGEFPARSLRYCNMTTVPVWDVANRMGATGDWTRGFSVSDAYVAGVELATAILGEATSKI
eukprot:gnl/TRDRNA2_/TRDRNA2_164208_c0_seq2.p1 gnl/TRDRNA2_/TRDRNA2_164208_c0~~gnl/TRDRNA2_/TRDRNA2_164208_c0_seq2.p1  ORF type:complete len:526 (+),score=64.49 gnl/TRDRNA2_/TRDRNA2_164208_c0_seq2:56-1633(+)